MQARAGSTFGGGCWIAPPIITGGASVAHLSGQGTGAAAPSVAALAAAGTAPTISLAAGSTDVAGRVILTTGTAPSAGSIFTVTFGAAYATAPFVVPGASNPQAAAYMYQMYTTSAAASFTCVVNNTLQASTAYSWNYHVID